MLPRLARGDGVYLQSTVLETPVHSLPNGVEVVDDEGLVDDGRPSFPGPSFAHDHPLVLDCRARVDWDWLGDLARRRATHARVL